MRIGLRPWLGHGRPMDHGAIHESNWSKDGHTEEEEEKKLCYCQSSVLFESWGAAPSTPSKASDRPSVVSRDPCPVCQIETLSRALAQLAPTAWGPAVRISDG